MLRTPISKVITYKLFKGRKPNISHLRIFASKCFVLNNGKQNLNKFDYKANEALFLVTRYLEKHTKFIIEEHCI